MRVLIVNTSELQGGAAIASKRLVAALNNNGVKAKMLVDEKESDDITVAGLPRTLRSRWRFLWERWCVFCHLHFSKAHLWDVDMANTGYDITRLREFREADVIHLEWVNHGMLSLKGIGKILGSGKPVVWTLHDMWPATALCHLTRDCTRYREACAPCPYLPQGSGLATRVFRRKQRLLGGRTVFFVACSKWLATQARTSRLLAGQKVSVIPNPIDTHTFRPGNRDEARRRLQLPAGKRIILFVAYRATTVMKGMDYLVEACRKLVDARPESRTDTAVVILGGHAGEYERSFLMPVVAMGYVTDPRTIVDTYRAADVFVLPSLSENLPNTIMEAMACGVPCVAFRTGGIPEEIDHLKNGYVARYKDADDLARGISWTLDEADRDALSRNAVHKVATEYSQRAVAMRYIDLYQQALAQKNYKL